MAYRKVSDDSLSAVANAIRAKSGTSANLVFPDEFVSAISGLSGDDAFVSDAAFDYEINPINGVTYGFALNSAGFYESTNQKRSSSYSICRVKLTVKRTCDITFDVINYAENRYDYGIFGNLDASLSLSASADTANVYKSYSSEHSADAVQLTYYAVAPGDHFIDVKYIKDSSQDSNNDSLQFKIRQVGGLPQETIDKILAADPDLKAENIRAGVDIFGVVGTHEGASAPALQSKTVTPSENSQSVVPDSGYDGLSKVTVGAISSTYVGSGVPLRGAQTITPGTSNQQIAAGQYLSGAQTVKGDANLLAENIRQGVTIFNVAGTLKSGGLPSGITALASGEFTPSSDISSDYTVTHGLGVSPDFYLLMPVSHFTASNSATYGIIAHAAWKRSYTTSSAYGGYSLYCYVFSATGVTNGGNSISEADISKKFGTNTFVINATSYYKLLAGTTYRWVCGKLDGIS